ncbi:MAG: hypothetical protein ACR2JC_20110 [Chloroflexota bacterium]
MERTRTQIYLTPELRRRLDDAMRRDNKSMAQIVREALDVYIPMEEPDAEEALATTFGSTPSLAIPSREEWERG